MTDAVDLKGWKMVSKSCTIIFGILRGSFCLPFHADVEASIYGNC